MNATIDLLRDELERSFDLDDMRRLASELLGYPSQELGSHDSRGTFAQSLVSRCATDDALQALADAICMRAPTADARLKDLSQTQNGELKPGNRIGSMEVVRKLGEGGLGVVYLCEEAEGANDRGPIALKVIRPEYARDRSAVNRYKTFSRALQGLNLPNLAAIVEVGELQDARPWVAAQYVEGQTLAGHIGASGPLHHREAVPIFDDVLQALIALHERGLVHGDVKTENVLLVRSGSDANTRPRLAAVLVDGGAERLLARVIGRPDQTGLLPAFGTAKAMAPELARGEGASAKTDLYALGILMYEALTGRPPFSGKSAIDIVAQHLMEAPAAPSSLLQQGAIPPELDALVLRMLAKNPDERMRSAVEVANVLAGVSRSAEQAQNAFDPATFQARLSALRDAPEQETLARSLEQLGGGADAWRQIAEAFLDVAQSSLQHEVRGSLTLRAANIWRTELQDYEAAEPLYRQVLEIQPDDARAWTGLEEIRRASGDHDALLELLLGKLERLPEGAAARIATLQEIAVLYERVLGDTDNAFVAWLQVVSEAPTDARAVREVERLTRGEARWQEVLDTLGHAAQALQATLTGQDTGSDLADIGPVPSLPPQIMPEQAREAVQRARAALHDAEQAAMLAAAEAEARASDAALAESYLEEATQASAEVHAQAEAAVQQVEALDAVAAEGDAAAQAATAEALADAGAEAERLVELADQAATEVEQAQQSLEQANSAAAQAHEASDQASMTQQLAASELENAQARLDRLESTGDTLLDESELTDASEFELLDADDLQEAPTQSAANPSDLAALYTLMGRWYAERLERPDYALPCYSQALALNPESDTAYEGMIQVYRQSQAWSELAGMLLERADHSQSPAKSRDYRAEAAVIAAEHLDMADDAEVHLRRVLDEDPSHAVACRGIESVLQARGDWESLVAVLDSRARFAEGEAAVEIQVQAAGLCEDRLDRLDMAAERYRIALEWQPQHISALKGLERIHARDNDYEALLDNLRRQVDVVAVPKQRLALLERIGAIEADEFAEYTRAIETYRRVLEIDPAHEDAQVALARLYRQAQRFDELVDVYERHARTSSATSQKVELLLQAVHVLMDDLGAPERALALCERVLSMQDDHPEALDIMARLEASVGDASAALTAVERLAHAEREPSKRADLWVRAAKLLEEHGDRDGAIQRYRRALDADMRQLEAVSALRRIYGSRGDVAGGIELLQHEIEITEGARRTAELLTELGALYEEGPRDYERASTCFAAALEHDATQTRAQAGLARLAHAAGRHADAAAYFEPLLSRIEELPPTLVKELCLAATDSFQHLERLEQAEQALERALAVTSNDPLLLERLAQVRTRAGNPAGAELAYGQLLQVEGEHLEAPRRAQLLLAMGDVALQAGHKPTAIEVFKSAAALEPKSDKPLAALTRAYGSAGKWHAVVELLQERTARQTGIDRFNLLVETGDVYLQQMQDNEGAVRCYVSALEIQPSDRNLLAKLMSVYSQGQDWKRLIEVILRIAEMVEDPQQLAKYYHTAATIAKRELKRYAEAATYYQEALANSPTLDGAFQGLAECLTQEQDWEKLERAYATRIDRLGDQLEGRALAALYDARAHVLEHRLNRQADALPLYEQAQSLDPDNRSRNEMLTELYTRHPKRYFQKAVAAHQQLLSVNGFRVESYQALRRIYTTMRKPDESWCCCQALRTLNMADVEEEKFFKKYRLTRLAKIKSPLSDDLWQQLVVHPSQDVALTRIFAAIQPAVVASQAQAPEAFGIHRQHQIDPTNDPAAIVRMIVHASESIQVPLPPMFHRGQDAGGLSFLFTSPSSMGIGEGARAGGPPQALAFVAGRHLTYYRQGHFLRQFVPTGSGLRAWLLAALRLSSPDFPVPEPLQQQVGGYHAALQQHLSAPQRELLRSLSEKLLAAQPELDMRRWIAGVDLTADRVGFLLANDLKLAKAVIEASPEDAAAVPRRERTRQLLLFSVSPAYLELRHRLGIALGD